MTQKVVVRIEGLEDIKFKLKSFTPEVNEAIEKEIKISAINIQREAKKICPWRSNRLRSSIAIQLLGSGGRINAAEIGSYHVEYAPYVEFGTRYMKAEPYLRPAYDAEIPKYKANVAKILRDLK